jgi:hypothetical protein
LLAVTAAAFLLVVWVATKALFGVPIASWTNNNAKPVWNQAVSAGELPVQDIAESVCFAFITRRKPLILRQLLPLHPQ